MRSLALLLAAATLLLAGTAVAQTAAQTETQTATGADAPWPPCAPGVLPQPAYGAEGAPPALQIWEDIELAGDPACLGALQGRMNSVAALAGSFRFAGGPDALAARFGAVSKTLGLLYWSTTDQAWRELVSEAVALRGADTALSRPDFTAAELRSGRRLYFTQNDTRSSGLNLYRMTALRSGPDRLVVEVVNESAVSFAFVTLFKEKGLLSLHFLQRLDGDLWGYYGLAAIREGSVAGHTKSLVNRAAAFYRFLQGQPGDAAPPLAR